MRRKLIAIFAVAYASIFAVALITHKLMHLEPREQPPMYLMNHAADR